MRKASYQVINLNEQRSTLFGIDQEKTKFIDGNLITAVGHLSEVNSVTDSFGERNDPLFIMIEKGFYVRSRDPNQSLKYRYSQTPFSKDHVKIEFDYIDNYIANHEIGLERIYGNNILGSFSNVVVSLKGKSFAIGFEKAPGSEAWEESDRQIEDRYDWMIRRNYSTEVPFTEEEKVVPQLLILPTVYQFTSNKTPYVVIEHWKFVKDKYKPEEGEKPVRHYMVISPNKPIKHVQASRLTQEVISYE